MQVFVILPDQLFYARSAIEELNQYSKVFIAEDPYYFNERAVPADRMVALRTAMRLYADMLAAQTNNTTIVYLGVNKLPRGIFNWLTTVAARVTTWPIPNIHGLAMYHSSTHMQLNNRTFNGLPICWLESAPCDAVLCASAEVGELDMKNRWFAAARYIKKHFAVVPALPLDQLSRLMPATPVECDELTCAETTLPPSIHYALDQGILTPIVVQCATRGRAANALAARRSAATYYKAHPNMLTTNRLRARKHLPIDALADSLASFAKAKYTPASILAWYCWHNPGCAEWRAAYKILGLRTPGPTRPRTELNTE